ncbi:sigma-54 interaction domain-containing protein [Variovorax sp. VNK109]|uniref:sigma-54 interaction domain-containing protein n=1 Tax=Variovorax sp. VNK109 TaxID=3400919 RepID=UPI003C0EE51F
MVDAVVMPTFSGLQLNLPHLAEQSFFSMMEATAAGTLATDRDGVIVWINEKYCQLLHLPAGQMLGRQISGVLPGTRLPEVLTTGEPILLDVMEHAGRQYLVSRFPIKDQDETIIGAFGFVLSEGSQAMSLVRHWSTSFRMLPTAGDGDEIPRQPDAEAVRFIGETASAVRVRDLAQACAASDASVLITGPTGSGKEVVAKSIHSQSARSGKALVAVNVAAIPETLFESEFFGSAPGAFTGADRRGRIGKLQAAHGGTLFLDEIGDLPQGAQVKLLRFLESGEFEQLGANRVQRANVRVIAATSTDLRKAVSEGRFRADLYYRLAVLHIPVPSLDDRREDIALLSVALLERIARRSGAVSPRISPAAFSVLEGRTWPGNVRELRNVLERCCAFAPGAEVDAARMRSFLEDEPESAQAPQGSRPLHEIVASVEREALVNALDRADGSIAAAAELLEISRTTFYKKARAFGIAI